MVDYMRAVGLSVFSTPEGVNRLSMDMFMNSDTRSVCQRSDDTTLVEYIRSMGDGLGVSLRVTYSSDDRITSSVLMPYFVASRPCTYLDIEVDEAPGGGFVALAEDVASGNEIAFSVQNLLDFAEGEGTTVINESSVRVSGISTSGRIILPVERDEEFEEQRQEEERSHMELLRRARAGDAAAMADLEELEEATGDTIRERLMDEDFLTVVEGFLMPSEEEEHFSFILGDVLEVHPVQNTYTDENLLVLTLNVAGTIMQLCINQADLEGMAMPGMRFLGACWMQGWID